MEKDKDGNYTVVVYDGRRSTNVHTYPEIEKAIRKSLSRKDHIFCELGRPSSDARDKMGIMNRMMKIDTSRVCGVMEGVKYNEKGEVISATFRPYGPLSEQAVDLIEGWKPDPQSLSVRGNSIHPYEFNNPRFGLRVEAATQPDGTNKLDRVIAWDLILE